MSPTRAGLDRTDHAQSLEAPPTTNHRLGLPEEVRACLFDLDGVLTDTAKVHAAAWKDVFDGYLRSRSDTNGEPFVPFDADTDYHAYVDGETRADGIRSFLRARAIELADGAHGERPGTVTVQGLGDAKNAIFLRNIREYGVEAYPGSVRYVRAAVSAGLRRAVVSSSANCAAVLAAAGLAEFFEVRIDGLTVEADHLAGKPAPDTFLAAARALGVDPSQAAVFEDSLSGVEAGRKGGFGFVIGVDRVGQAEVLGIHGADVVVSDLAELLDRL